ncbi:hypothetical protein BDU57DRAFT_518883 [Ampelomyces quisqualis]|uniref:Uncharacterized protein n=1 Tax=Ampelomyces quisqualis TaxID=50730 RepID=A0A6A5QF59_AMPQU|nr:hypothetical protein BDU57DRAFT_518883 [Ampelomyces quisqualis]
MYAILGSVIISTMIVSTFLVVWQSGIELCSNTSLAGIDLKEPPTVAISWSEVCPAGVTKV